MAVKNQQITYVNKLGDKDKVYLNGQALTYQDTIKKDYNNVVQNINNIYKAYHKLSKNSKVKGTILQNIRGCEKACNKRVEATKSAKTKLETQLNKDVLNYVLTMLGTNADNLSASINELNSMNNQ